MKRCFQSNTTVSQSSSLRLPNYSVYYSSYNLFQPHSWNVQFVEYQHTSVSPGLYFGRGWKKDRMLTCGLLELKQEEQQCKQEIPSSSQESPRANYWLLFEDCYFYLMKWVSILEEYWPLKPSHNENHLCLLSEKTTALAPCDCSLCLRSAVQSSSMSIGWL